MPLHTRRAVPSWPAPAMVAVAGGPGTGKSTFLATVSESRPSSWAARGQAGPAELGRLTIDDATVLHLCTVPDVGHLPWPSSSTATLVGAVVVVDPRRLTDALAVVSWFTAHGVPVVVALNISGGSRPDLDDVRAALDLGQEVPLIACDCRERTAALQALTALVERAISEQAGPGKAVVAAVS